MDPFLKMTGQFEEYIIIDAQFCVDGKCWLDQVIFEYIFLASQWWKNHNSSSKINRHILFHMIIADRGRILC